MMKRAVTARATCWLGHAKCGIRAHPQVILQEIGGGVDGVEAEVRAGHVWVLHVLVGDLQAASRCECLRIRLMTGYKSPSKEAMSPFQGGMCLSSRPLYPASLVPAGGWPDVCELLLTRRTSSGMLNSSPPKPRPLGTCLGAPGGSLVIRAGASRATSHDCACTQGLSAAVVAAVAAGPGRGADAEPVLACAEGGLGGHKACAAVMSAGQGFWAWLSE